jgi:Fe-S-cluster-containing hydrogenase component 2
LVTVEYRKRNFPVSGRTLSLNSFQYGYNKIEAIRNGGNIMARKLVLDLQKCPANHSCPAVKVCPYNALSQEDNNHAPVIDYNLCVACGACTRVCGKQALQIVEA